MGGGGGAGRRGGGGGFLRVSVGFGDGFMGVLVGFCSFFGDGLWQGQGVLVCFVEFW